MGSLSRGTLNAIEVSVQRYAGGMVMPTHTHAESTVSLFFRGGAIEEIGGSELHPIEPMSVVFKPGGVPHALEVLPEGLCAVTLVVSREVDRLLRAAGLTDRSRWDYSGQAAIHVLRLAVAMRRGDLAVAEHELLKLGGIEVRTPGPRIAGIVEHVHARHHRPLSTRQLAEAYGTHPSSLARSLRRELGCGPKDLLARRRLTAAAHRLCTSADPLASIASGSGFSDQSHMTRAFSSVLGVSPGRFRSLMSDDG